MFLTDDCLFTLLRSTFSFYQISNVVGYAVGEYIKEDEEEGYKGNEYLYEIVTAWIHPRYQLLNL